MGHYSNLQAMQANKMGAAGQGQTSSGITLGTVGTLFCGAVIPLAVLANT